MTNAIEVTKKAMFDELARVKQTARNSSFSQYLGNALGNLESMIEAHLEQLRQDHEALHVTARERFESIQALEQANEELRKELQGANNLADQRTEQLGKMTGERDDIQGRLHAIDHKFFAQDQALKLAGEELRDRKIEIGSLIRTRGLAERMAGYRLKQLDGTLQELAALRKMQGGTSASDSKEKPASETSEAKSAMVLDAALVDCQRIVTNWAFGGVKAKESMRQLQASLSQKVELTIDQRAVKSCYCFGEPCECA